MITDDQITSIVFRIVSAQVEATGHYEGDKPAIAQNSSIADLGLDELSTVEILMSIEETFGIELADDDVTLSSTIDGIAKLVSWTLHNTEARTSRAVSIRSAWSDFSSE